MAVTDETAATCGQCGLPEAHPFHNDGTHAFAPAAKPPDAETLTPMARAWLERFTPESWEGFPGYEPEVATAIRQALATIDAAQREVAELRAGRDDAVTHVALNVKTALALGQEVGELRSQRDNYARAQLKSHDRNEKMSARNRELEARAAALEAQHEQLRQMILTQGETIHEQEERIEALAAERDEALADRAMADQVLSVRLQELAALEAALAKVQEAWSQSWDCSRDPGHGIMFAALAGLPAGKP